MRSAVIFRLRMLLVRFVFQVGLFVYLLTLILCILFWIWNRDTWLFLEIFSGNGFQLRRKLITNL